jgi:hypothetical protein
MDIIWKIADEKIRKAMEDGAFDQLPGFGKPLELDDLSHVPEELRAGYLMLKNAGYAGEDADLKKELMTIEDLLRCCEDEKEKERLRQKRNEKLLRLDAVMKKRNESNSRALRDYQKRIEDKFRS